MTDEALVLWGFGLMAGAIVVFLLEALIPSAGVLSLAALALGVGSVVAFFAAGTVWGILSTAFLIVMIPAAIFFFFRVMPNTPVGRALFLNDDEPEEQRASREQRAREHAAARHVGAEGVASTDLHPSGRIEVGGEKHDALAVGGLIDRGQRVKVVGIWGAELKVRAIN
ncbi:MAG: NfeD family protein [Planctomycetota bacterium]